MDFGFLVTVSALRIGKNRHWSFVFLGIRHSSHARDFVGRFLGSDALPLVGRFGIANLAVRQPEKVGAPPFGVSSPAVLGDFNEPESTHLSQARRDGVPVDSILDKMVEGDGQPSVVVPTVMGHLDFQAVKNPTSTKAQRLKGWRLHHLDSTCRKLADDPIPAAGGSMVAHDPASPGTEACNRPQCRPWSFAPPTAVGVPARSKPRR
jgi:hypothetical protein